MIGESFIDGDNVALALGDNLFHGAGLSAVLRSAANHRKGGHIFGVQVADASRYGVVEVGHDGNVLSLEEKPEIPKSNIAVVGLYFFDDRVTSFAKSVAPSARGELEITDVIQAYINDGSLRLDLLPRGLTWLDTGTHESMMQAAQYVYSVEERSGVKIACLEEIALKNGWLTKATLKQMLKDQDHSSYSRYLRQLLNANF